MQSFSRGWSFLKQAWSMAFKDKYLLKPSVYALIAGMVISVIRIIPIVGAAVLFGDTSFGNIILFVMGAVMIFVQFVVAYVFSAMTVYLIYGYLAEGDGRLDKAWGSFAAISSIFSPWRRLRRSSTCSAMRRNAIGAAGLPPAWLAAPPACCKSCGRRRPT